MDCRLIVCLLLWSLGLAARAVTASAAPPAGIGTLDQITITGNTVFSTDEIRRVVATHPAAIEASQWPQKRWMEELRSLIEQGYRNCGHAEAVVKQGQGAELQIQEGHRFLDGEIRLSGIPEELAAAVRERLTGPSYPANAVPEPVHVAGGRTAFRWVDDKGAEVKPGAPAWQPLKNGSFTATREKVLNNAVLNLLEFYGRTGAACECRLEPNSRGGIVDLVIDITNLGTEVEVDEFMVTGMVNHTEEEILTYLDLKPGKFTLLDRLSIERKLWLSGRFLGHRTELIEPFRKGDRFRLEIRVKECPQAPKLGEPFSESQLVLLRACLKSYFPQSWASSSGFR